jgi:hypothetical protein
MKGVTIFFMKKCVGLITPVYESKFFLLLLPSLMRLEVKSLPNAGVMIVWHIENALKHTSHVRWWVPCHHSMAHQHVVDGGTASSYGG